jgi:heme exporter protein D
VADPTGVSLTAPRGRGERLAAYLGAGPRLGRAAHAVVGLAAAAAFASLGAQVRALLGERGLLPAAESVAAIGVPARSGGAGDGSGGGLGAALASWLDAPSVFRWVPPTDDALVAGCALGAGLGVAAAVGLFPRVALLCAAPLYLSYVWLGADLMAFQWDAMLVEACVLAALAPSRPAGPWRASVPVVLLRLLVLKLYLMSGLAKLASPLGDWLDGSAMRFYYETAPLPGPLAWHAHHLPAGWHTLETYATLALEVPVPALALGPRALRRLAAAGLSALQVVNLATANYGFFVWLSLGLHLVLLDDADLASVGARLGMLGRRWPSRAREVAAGLARGATRGLASGATRGLAGGAAADLSRAAAGFARAVTAVVVAYGLAWTLASGAVALTYFARVESTALRAVARAARATHLANGYHLFASVTRERVEPQIEVTLDGATWQELDLPAKPGDPRRRPPLVAPHLPRVDFRLWFYGLTYDAGAPAYAVALLDRLCGDPTAVGRLLASPPPAGIRAARFAFHRYRFATPETRARTGAWWWRERLGSTEARRCGR